MFSDNMKIGILLVSLGFLFLSLGVLLFFDSGLLTVGNILLLAGFPFLLGFQKTLAFFNPFRRKDRWKGIVAFFTGIIMVLFVRWPAVGMAVEVVGLVEMFAKFLPNVVSTLRMLPVIGPFFESAGVRWVVDRIQGASKRRLAV
jgi:hypothetical protein